MTRLTAVAAALLGALALTGCTSTGGNLFATKTNCAALDWGGIGFEDGSNGRSVAEFDRRVAACQPGGPPPNRTAYMTGRESGLRSYCTAERGYSEGYSGREYYGVCPVELAGTFQDGYLKGIDERRAYALRPGISVGVGIGSGGYSRVGIGVGIGSGRYGRIGVGSVFGY